MIVLEAGEFARFESVAFDPTGTRVAAGHTLTGDVLVWAVAGGRVVHRLRVGSVAMCAAADSPNHPPATRIYALSNNTLLRSDLETRHETPVSAPSCRVSCFAMAPNGRRLVWHQTRPTLGVRGELSSWGSDGPVGSRPGWCRLVQEGPVNGWSRSLVFLPGGDLFVSAEQFFTPESRGHQHRLVVRAADTGDPVRARSDPDCECSRVAVSPLGTCLVIQAGDVLRAFPTDFANHPRTISNDSKKHFTDIAFHPSGRYLAATSNDATMKLYDTTSWEVAKTYTWNIGRMRGIAFSPDGTLAAAGSKTGKVVVWDVDL